MEGGREHSHLDVVEWAQKAEQLGVGEILLTSVDQEGTRKGFDIQLTRSVSEAVGIPVIASGGMGSLGDPVNVVTQGKADAVAVASVIHYNQLSLEEIRKAGLDGGINFRIPLGGEA